MLTPYQELYNEGKKYYWKLFLYLFTKSWPPHATGNLATACPLPIGILTPRQAGVGYAEYRTQGRSHTVGPVLGQRDFSDPHLPKMPPLSALTWRKWSHCRNNVQYLLLFVGWKTTTKKNTSQCFQLQWIILPFSISLYIINDQKGVFII